MPMPSAIRKRRFARYWGLARCYWNQRCLLEDQGDLAGQLHLWHYRALGMPTDFMDGRLAKLNQISQS